MSNKAFYQTFFQTEQLFRRGDDLHAFPALEVAAFEGSAVNSLVIETMPAPAVSIQDPVMPSIVVMEAPLPVEEVYSPVEPVEENPVRPEPPSLSHEPGNTVSVPTPQQPAPSKPATPLISQKVLILVDDDLLPSDLLFLEKILKAVHLDVDGVDLLNVHGTKNVNFSELLAGKYIHHFFTFGVPFSRLNLDIMMDRYQPVRFEGITFLMADPLPAIEADVALKKKLWESLKKIFLWR
ncbi:hypothetical protein [Fibrella arboris]|uniref:hypothetical protein n=1 Tax=Fibrella arboris TaxID=3242486 RepID=UPI00352249AC